MQQLNVEQFRAAVESGGILSVTLKAEGPAFSVRAETQRGDAVLIDTRKKQPRMFVDPRKALKLLREFGIHHTQLNAEDWQPEQAESLRVSRPDSAAQMREAHEAAELKRILEERIREADDPNTVWIDHDTLFDAIEASLAD